MSIQKLPNEVHLQIFEKLSVRDLRDAVSLVCRRWCTLTQNFGLFKFIVNLDSPFNNSIKQALADFKKYPTFRHKVKYIKLGDYRNYEDGDDIAGYYDVEKKSLDTDDIVAFYDVSKLNLVIESCPTFEGLEIWIRCSEFLFYILEELFLKENPFGSQLKSLKLDLTMKDNLFRAEEYERKLIEMDLMGLTHHYMPNLEELFIYSFNDDDEEERLIFMDDGVYLGINNIFLRKIHIACIHCVMTISCLEYIISGCLVKLEELDLLVTLIYDSDEDEIIEKNDYVLDRTKTFCLTKLKRYYINIFNGRDSEPVLEIKNYGNNAKK